MLLALLWDRYPAAAREANFRYYEPRCGHGSSLSPADARAGRGAAGRCRSWPRATSTRPRRSTSTTRWATPPRACISARSAACGRRQCLASAGSAPLPPGSAATRICRRRWRALRFPIEWRGRRVRFALRQAPLTLTTALDHGRSLLIEVGGLRHELHAGRDWTCRWSQDELRWQEVIHDRA